MTVQVLIATRNHHFFARGYRPPFDDYLVIDQVAAADARTPERAPEHAKVFCYQETGLAKSRNAALARASGEICLFSDDDIVFLEDARETIARAFAAHPAADIITFQARIPTGAPFKTYPTKPKWLGRRTIMRVTSWEIAFRRRAILAAGLTFDERFGLGARFPTGEENIFLRDALGCGLKILYVPQPIVIHPAQSSGSDFTDETIIMAKGAMFYRMFGRPAHWINALFAWKKSPASPFSARAFYRLMSAGMKQYREEINAP